MEKTFHFRGEKIVHDGSLASSYSGYEVRVHGMLLGEEAIIEVKKRHGILFGSIKELLLASPARKLPEELHYLSCSPWQVMDYPTQIAQKTNYLNSLFGYYDDIPKIKITPAQQFFGYRTKIEFSFCDRMGDQEIPLSLAFHERGGGKTRIPLERGCMLASDKMNSVALDILKELRNRGYHAHDLKTLVIRESKSEGDVVALLYAKKQDIIEFPVSQIPSLSGFHVFYSTEKSPASVATKYLWGSGDDHLTEILNGVSVRYAWDSFFQNNVPVFLDTMNDLSQHVAPNERVLEIYAGAGTIGLLLAKHNVSIHAVEIVQSSVTSAMQNAVVNGITNYHAECLPAEDIDSALFSDFNTILLDPPRAGLHPKLLRDLLAACPKKIIYLSCNPETQARDYAQLSHRYHVDFIHGYDFYPQTAHVELLMVLSLRD